MLKKMKNILRNSVLILSGILVFNACEDPDAIRIPELTETANVRIQVNPVPCTKILTYIASFVNSFDII